PAIIADLCGPKIRVTRVPEGFSINDGDTLSISNDEGSGDITVTSGISFSNLKLETNILINDGRIQLSVSNISSANLIECKVLVGGEIELGKGVNFPGVTLGVPAMTEQDDLDLRLALDKGADWIALSFVRSADDIINVHNIMDECNKRLPVMAKIEKWEALEDLQNITEAFDGIMVARGDLGVEIPSGKVPAAQKEIIELAGVNGKPVVIATQLLESMVENHTPTRAEVSDIANAIFDGVDCLMVTGETAMGNYPVEVIKTLQQVILETEGSSDISKNPLPEVITKTADAISHAVCQIAEDLEVKVIMSMTHSGNTARMISRYRPNSSIYALTPFNHIIRQLQLVWGVRPIRVDNYDNVEKIPVLCNDIIKEIDVLQPGEQFVITGGVPMGIAGTTNYLSIQVHN
ncbi:MAG: pyruvate kinase, partial [Candidatus Neomarinimicrobiota bacterium]